MSRAPRQPRAPRGRVVIVGSSPDLGGLAPRVVHAEDLFDAMGQVTSASAAETVAAVVLPASMLDGPGSVALEAFRRIDPSLRVIAVAGSDAERARLEQAPNGFDRILRQPLNAARLAEALDESAAPGAPEVAAGAPPDPSEGAPRTARRRAPGREPEEPRFVESIEISPASAPPPQGDLGDTDLVHALLTSPLGLRELALRLIAQQTGWNDLALAPQPSAEKGSAVEVRYGARCYGILTSTAADRGKLQRWAEWLAGWLALDQAYRDYRDMAYRDDLTGAWNRRYYGAFMRQVLPRAARARRAVTVLFFDIDGFKRYNDQFGHEAGDEILKETVRLLESVIRSGDRVCRIGGDEFVVVFCDLEGPRSPGSNPPEAVEQIAARFQEQIWGIKFPKLGIDAPGTLSISGGLATFPWDGNDPQSLLRHADQLALQSKRSGKNVITMGPGAQRQRRERDGRPH